MPSITLHSCPPPPYKLLPKPSPANHQKQATPNASDLAKRTRFRFTGGGGFLAFHSLCQGIAKLRKNSAQANVSNHKGKARCATVHNFFQCGDLNDPNGQGIGILVTVELFVHSGTARV